MDTRDRVRLAVEKEAHRRARRREAWVVIVGLLLAVLVGIAEWRAYSWVVERERARANREALAARDYYLANWFEGVCPPDMGQKASRDAAN